MMNYQHPFGLEDYWWNTWLKYIYKKYIIDLQWFDHNWFTSTLKFIPLSYFEDYTTTTFSQSRDQQQNKITKLKLSFSANSKKNE